MIYAPAEDSHLLARFIPLYVKSKSFLDMGAGSGIQSEVALKAGAKSVIASEIDKGSLKLLRDKFRENKKIKIIKSDLFNNIGGKFGVIAFNPPYLPRDTREDAESAKATTGGRKGDEIIFRFLKQAPEHLEKNGIILLVVSSLTPQNKIISLIKSLKLSKKIKGREKFFMESLEVWEIMGNSNELLYIQPNFP